MKNIKLFGLILGLVFALSSGALAQTPGVSLTAVGGGKVAVDSQKGKVVVLAIGATWLPLSKQQASITAQLAKKYAGRNVVVYFVATDSALAKSKNFASDEQIQLFGAKNKVNAAMLRDPEGALTLKQFKIDQLPSFVILDKNGNSAGEPFGGVTPNQEGELVKQISARIDELL